MMAAANGWWRTWFPRAELDKPSLRLFLRERLPEHMIPAAFSLWNRFPKPQRKTGPRKRCRRRSSGQPRKREFVPPQDEIEERLVNLWQEVLSVNRISVTDNYFDLGGHSLLALRLFSEIKFCFQLELPLATLFYAPTVRTMAGVIRDSGVQAAAPVVPIQPNGTKPAIFCIGALNGEVILFRRLAWSSGLISPFTDSSHSVWWTAFPPSKHWRPATSNSFGNGASLDRSACSAILSAVW
jgi:acyl carrier protein